MDTDLLARLGDLSLLLFSISVGVLLAAVTLGVRARRGRWSRLLVEYVGNAALDEPTESERRSPEPEPRHLVDRIAGAFDERKVPWETREPFLEDLRNVIRSERRLLAQRELDEKERRFLAARRWELAQRLELLIGEVPPEIVHGIKTVPFVADAE